MTPQREANVNVATLQTALRKAEADRDRAEEALREAEDDLRYAREQLGQEPESPLVSVYRAKMRAAVPEETK